MQRLAADVDDNEDVKPFRRPSTADLAPNSPGSPVAAISSNTDTLPVTVKQLAFSAIESAVEPVKQALASTALRKAAVRSALLAVIVALSFGSAIFAYILFYYLYVPRVGFTKEIWLQYGCVLTPILL